MLCNDMLRALLLALTLPLAARADSAIHRGFNFGDALETPKEGQWGVVLQEDYFTIIARAGFDSLRVPIDWVDHAGPAPDYTIDPKFFERIDWVVSNAEKNHFAFVSLDYHTDAGLIKDPDHYSDRFVAIWKQIAEHYRSAPDSICLELLNEPHDALTAAKWNALVARVLPVIRESNPTRTVVVGPIQWNAFDKLPELELPANDQHLLVTFHYYLPMQFTHQGASWVGPLSQQWLGTKRLGTNEETGRIAHDFQAAADWGKAHHRPIYLGEFGSYETGDMASRVRWTTCVARTAEKLGFPWTYWEFCASFGTYDPKAKEWRKPLLDALMPR